VNFTRVHGAIIQEKITSHGKFHKNPISLLGGVTLTRYIDGRIDGQTDGRADRQGDSYIPPNFVCGGHKYSKSLKYIA
jgi:hypothetical protein